jgi:cytochrome c nitrite reductase small subunit
LGTRERLLLLIVLGVAPALVTLATFALSFQRAEQVRFCADCHTMTPWVDDLHNPKSKSLAAMHFSNRWILNNQCYTCHADYGFLGPITTKLGSLRHVAIYYSGIGMPEQIKLREPFPNSNCLQCHGPAANFKNNPAHVAVMNPMLANQLSCVTCHQPIHTPKG